VEQRLLFVVYFAQIVAVTVVGLGHPKTFFMLGVL
jgi:hypothetical protein